MYVQAAKQRRKIPFWAMATLSLMPLWGFMYVRALTETAEAVEGPLGVGAEMYSSCASCHGAAGGGGVGYAFSGGEVLETFPHIEDQVRYVYYGTEGYNAAGVEIYGNPDREGGAHITGQRGVDAGLRRPVDPVRDRRRRVPRALHARRRRPDQRGVGRGVRDLVLGGVAGVRRLEAGTYDYTDAPTPPEMGERRDHADRPRSHPRLRGVGRLTAGTLDTDVLVVGGGPAGASVATWLARSGHHVTIVEKRPVARHKACGDALTPRAIRELSRLDVDPIALGGHRARRGPPRPR